MSRSGQDALLADWVWLRGYPECQGVVWRPFRMSGGLCQLSGSGERPFRMSGSGRGALLDVQEWTGVSPGCPVVVRRPSRMSGSGLEALLDVR